MKALEDLYLKVKQKILLKSADDNLQIQSAPSVRHSSSAPEVRHSSSAIEIVLDDDLQEECDTIERAYNLEYSIIDRVHHIISLSYPNIETLNCFIHQLITIGASYNRRLYDSIKLLDILLDINPDDQRTLSRMESLLWLGADPDKHLKVLDKLIELNTYDESKYKRHRRQYFRPARDKNHAINIAWYENYQKLIKRYPGTDISYDDHGVEVRGYKNGRKYEIDESVQIDEYIVPIKFYDAQIELL